MPNWSATWTLARKTGRISASMDHSSKIGHKALGRSSSWASCGSSPLTKEQLHPSGISAGSSKGSKSRVGLRYIAKTDYVNASIPKEKTGYYLFLKVTFWWAGRRFGFNHQGDDRTNKELLSESGRLKHVINASVYTHVPHMKIFDYILLYLCIPYSTWISLYIP